jgi:hypothetical protein
MARRLAKAWLQLPKSRDEDGDCREERRRVQHRTIMRLSGIGAPTVTRLPHKQYLYHQNDQQTVISIELCTQSRTGGFKKTET